MKKMFNDSKYPKFSGTCGHQEIHVENFENLKCPVCGMNFVLKAFDMNTQDNEKELDVTCHDQIIDDIGQVSNRFYGRSKMTEYHKIHMYCPNKCVEDIIFNVSNTTYGKYRELTEIEN